MTGLGKSNTGSSFEDIDFAIYCWPGDEIEVYESGASVESAGVAKHFGVWTPNDVFKVQVNPDSSVAYLKNDIVFHTSVHTASPHAFPLHVDTSLYSPGAEISNVAIYSETASAWMRFPHDTCTLVTWADPSNGGVATDSWGYVDGSPSKRPGMIHGSLRDTPASLAGAFSTQQLSYSPVPQSVSFRCDPHWKPTNWMGGQSAPNQMMGLGYQGHGHADIAFAVYCDVDGTFKISESGHNPTTIKDASWARDDVFTIKVTGTVVEYSKSGRGLFFTSSTAAAFPLKVAASMVGLGDKFNDVAICITPVTSYPTAAPTTAPTPPTSEPTAAPTAEPTAAPTSEPTPTPTAACTDTPASTAATASKITFGRRAGNPVNLELLEDGVVRFTDATCLEATLCNTCGMGGGGGSSLDAKLAALETKMDQKIADAIAIVSVDAKVAALGAALRAEIADRHATAAPTRAPTSEPTATTTTTFTAAFLSTITSHSPRSCGAEFQDDTGLWIAGTATSVYTEKPSGGAFHPAMCLNHGVEGNNCNDKGWILRPIANAYHGDVATWTVVHARPIVAVRVYNVFPGTARGAKWDWSGSGSYGDLGTWDYTTTTTSCGWHDYTFPVKAVPSLR
jgi:hypothetical protein